MLVELARHALHAEVWFEPVPGQKDLLKDRPRADVSSRQLVNGIGEAFVPLLGGDHIVGPAAELPVEHRQLSVGDAAARDRRDLLDLVKQAELVQAPQRTRVEESGAVASAGQCESDPLGLCCPVGAVLWLCPIRARWPGTAAAEREQGDEEEA